MTDTYQSNVEVISVYFLALRDCDIQILTCEPTERRNLDLPEYLSTDRPVRFPRIEL